MSSIVRSRTCWGDDQILLPIPGLYDRDDDDSELTLPAAFEKFLLPTLRLKSNAHRTKFRTVLDHWALAMGPLRLADLDGNDEALARFQAWLLEQRFARETVNRYVQQYVTQILRVCGPRDNRNRMGKGILRVVPYVPPLKTQRRLPRVATRRELERLYEAAGVAQWPQSRTLPAPLWWRVLYVLAFTYGARTIDAVPIKEKGKGLRRENLVLGPECPIAGVDLLSPDGWLCFHPEKTRGEKPELMLPLTTVVRRHLDALPAGPPGTLLLPCTTHYEDFRRQRLAIEAAAGVALPITLQVLRRASTTYWHLVHEGVGNYVTGHAPRGVNAKSYQNPLVMLLERTERGDRFLDRFEYPAAMIRGPI